MSDHYPVKAKLNIRLQGIKQIRKQRNKYDKCSEQQRGTLNKHINDKMRQWRTDTDISNHTNRQEQTNQHVLNILSESLTHIPKIDTNTKAETMSAETTNTLLERKQASENRNPSRFEELAKLFRKQKQKRTTF